MILVRSGWPSSFQYWRAILNAVSLASEPPDEKMALVMPSGASMSASSADSSIEGGLAVPANVA